MVLPCVGQAVAGGLGFSGCFWSALTWHEQAPDKGFGLPGEGGRSASSLQS